jgi:THO complex subunit 3
VAEDGGDVEMDGAEGVGAKANDAVASEGDDKRTVDTVESTPGENATVPAPASAPSSRPSKRAKTSDPNATANAASSSRTPPTQAQTDKSKLKGRDLTRARQLRRIKHSVVYSAHLLAMGLDPTGRYLAVGGQDALLSLYTSRDWVCVRTFDCVV